MSALPWMGSRGQPMFDTLQAPPGTWVERVPVVTSGAGWFQSNDGTDSVWVAATYKAIWFSLTGDNAYVWLGTADPTYGKWTPVNCPILVAMPLDAIDVFVRRAATPEVTLDYILIPY